MGCENVKLFLRKPLVAKLLPKMLYCEEWVADKKSLIRLKLQMFFSASITL
jgi:hypothetical protein